jgi:hypothetical protein
MKNERSTLHCAEDWPHRAASTKGTTAISGGLPEVSRKIALPDGEHLKWLRCYRYVGMSLYQ